MGGQSLDQATVTKTWSADLNLVDAFEKSKARLINFPRLEKKVMCMRFFFRQSTTYHSQIPIIPFFLSDSLLTDRTSPTALEHVTWYTGELRD